MLKPMLAKKWNVTDPTGWYMSEKYDGVRAIWDGKNFYSRNGKLFHAPDWFKEGMPDVVLDGELWLGRGRFDEVSGMVRRKHDVDWTGIVYLVFDWPEWDCSWASRKASLNCILMPPHCKVVHHVKCKGIDHLNEYEREILEKGGEGVMLINPDSRYENKRSSNLLKVKRFYDAEAVVVGYEPGEGRHEGRMGALLCEYGMNIIKIGTGFTDQQRECPPEIGQKIVFKYFEITADGMPRFPVYKGIRIDL